MLTCRMCKHGRRAPGYFTFLICDFRGRDQDGHYTPFNQWALTCPHFERKEEENTNNG